jgi:hypothetical protein
MSNIRQLMGRFRLQLWGKNHFVGWSMKPEEAISFIKSLGKTLLTFYGYSGMGYENENEVLRIARNALSSYQPGNTLVIIGGTEVGVGAIYPLAKSMGFETAGILTTEALEYPDEISSSVDHVCFIRDSQYGGKLPNSNELCPTSKAMVACSDILIAIGGNNISRDELLEGKRQGKPVHYFPAEMNHARAIRRAKYLKLSPPESFLGSVHEVFGKQAKNITTSTSRR